jgi:transposase-like protein
MNLIDVTKNFATDEQCLAYLESQRWPDGVRCIVCGNDKVSKITRKTKSKNVRAQIYQCLEPTCKHQFSATTGTIFADSHIPLHKWFMAISILVDAKKSMSAVQLQEHLGLGSYRTAWYMVHRIRKAMVDEFPTKLNGVVEVDETYIGGKSFRRHRKQPRPKKDMVIGMRERGGRVRFFHVPDLKKDTMKTLLDRHISSHVSRIMTDSAIVYDFAMDKDFQRKHRTVNHSIEWVKPTDISVHTNTIESAFSLLKRGMIGSFHHVSIKHLHRYLSEFEYRFNARKEADRFTKTLAKMAATDAMPYRELTAE